VWGVLETAQWRLLLLLLLLHEPVEWWDVSIQAPCPPDARRCCCCYCCCGCVCCCCRWRLLAVCILKGEAAEPAVVGVSCWYYCCLTAPRTKDASRRETTCNELLQQQPRLHVHVGAPVQCRNGRP
jgi:hypothetical protein